MSHVPRSRSLLSLGAALFLTFAIAAGALWTSRANAQPTPVPGQQEMSTITVSGTGSVNITPDTAMVALGVTSEDTSLEVAQDDASTRLAAITEVLKTAGVAEEDIQTSSYGVSPIPRYDNDGNYRGIQGYQVSATLSVTVRDTTILGKLLDDAVGAGANAVYGISFVVDDPSGPASEARALAVQDARAKADEYAEEAGVVIIGVHTLVETSAPAPKARDYSYEADVAAAAPSEVPISVGSTQVEVNVEIVFEVQQANG